MVEGKQKNLAVELQCTAKDGCAAKKVIYIIIIKSYIVLLCW